MRPASSLQAACSAARMSGSVRVAQHEEVEVLRLAGRAQRFDRRAQAGEHRGTCSLQIGMTIAVRAAGIERAHRRARRGRASAGSRPRPKSSTTAPITRSRSRPRPSAKRMPNSTSRPRLGERRAALGQHLGHRLRADAGAEQRRAASRTSAAQHQRRGRRWRGRLERARGRGPMQAAQRPAPAAGRPTGTAGIDAALAAADAGTRRGVMACPASAGRM